MTSERTPAQHIHARLLIMGVGYSRWDALDGSAVDHFDSLAATVAASAQLWVGPELTPTDIQDKQDGEWNRVILKIAEALHWCEHEAGHFTVRWDQLDIDTRDSFCIAAQNALRQIITDSIAKAT
jgi:hypothetical protein